MTESIPSSMTSEREWGCYATLPGLAIYQLATRPGIDAVGIILSPVFPTDSHPGAPTLGPLRFAAWARRAPLPVYALGGVNAVTARRLAASNAAGLAGIGFAIGSASRQKPGGR